MWSRATPVKHRARTGGLELLAIWEVDASPAYHVHWNAAWNAGIPPQAHVAWLTLRGNGILRLRDGRVAELSANTLVFTRCHDVAEYACAGSGWRFDWVMFAVPVTAQIPPLRPLAVPAAARNSREIGTVIRALRKGSDAQRALAAATFQRLLLEWLALAENRHGGISGLAGIERVVEEMHDSLDGSFQLPEMAKAAGMSEAVFRRRFRAATGQSPKRFYLELRLEQAAALLRQGPHSVAEVADMLGFHDAFHFSNAFARQFGKPPSRWRKAEPA